MRTVLITGGTGLIGQAITKALRSRSDKVIILTRDPQAHKAQEGIEFAAWNVESQTIDQAAVAKADVILHLAGANVADKRWSEKRKEQILESRTQSGRLLVQALNNIPNKVTTVISASAIGWYGPDNYNSLQNGFKETDPHATDFLGQTCAAWESAIKPVTELGKRLVIIRTGIVLSTEGGAYPEFRNPLKLGLAPILGGGQQIVSWIHIDDIVRFYLHAIDNENWSGIYNAVAPKPVTSKELIMQMARINNRFFLPLPAPAFLLKAALGEMSIEVLKSTKVSAAKAEKDGFIFLYSSIDSAIRQLSL